MAEENNIEKNIRNKFKIYAQSPFAWGYTNWNSFIQNPENIKNINSIKIEIDYNLNLENWNFSKLNFEFIIKSDQTISFKNCSFKSLKIASNSDVILNEFNLNGCSFQGDAEINVKLSSLKFGNQAIFSNKFHGNKCIIKSNLDISLANVEFGNPNSKKDFKLNILSGSKFYGNAQFYAKKLLIETNSVDLNCSNFTFNVNELVIDGKKDSALSGDIKSGIQNEILLKNLKNVKNFSWINADTNPKKLSFENAGIAIFDSLKNIELSGSADSITGKFEDCNFKNISCGINAEIYGQSKFINCKNIATERKIFIRLDSTTGNTNNPHNITIENSTITKLHLSQNHKLCVKDSSLVDIILNQCNLLKIEDSEIKNITLENCQFNDAIILNDVTFLQSPHISNIKFSSHNVEMRNLKFKENLSPQASGSYRALMKACQNAGYENGVIFFHAKELETRHNYLTKEIESLKLWNINNYLRKIFPKSKNYLPKSLKINNLFSKNKFTKFISNYTEYCFNILIIPLKAIGIFLIEFIKLFSAKENNKIVIESILLNFHKHFSEYGEDLFKPLKWLIQIFCSMCFWFFVLDYFFYESDVNKFYLSLKNSLGPLIFALPKGFIEENLKSLPSSTKILCFLQTVICSSIWFVWFFMVRRRFKI